ncbi:hypothetical protein D9Z22_02510 [Escherichia coli]|nr:hypothetical protein [Escherichia coli]
MRYRLASPTKSNPIRSRIIQCPPGFFRTSSESIQSGAENIVKNDAAHFCVTQGKKMQIVDLKTEGAGLHGVARLTFKCGE